MDSSFAIIPASNRHKCAIPAAYYKKRKQDVNLSHQAMIFSHRSKSAIGLLLNYQKHYGTQQ